MLYKRGTPQPTHHRIGSRISSPAQRRDNSSKLVMVALHMCDCMELDTRCLRIRSVIPYLFFRSLVDDILTRLEQIGNLDHGQVAAQMFDQVMLGSGLNSTVGNGSSSAGGSNSARRSVEVGAGLMAVGVIGGILIRSVS
jgi:hypothetical protein